MAILVTGSSGWLGRHIVSRLRARGDAVVGLDPVGSRWTDIEASVADRDAVACVFKKHDITGVIHAGARHKPDMEHRAPQDFIDVNVTGTLNLLDCASDAGAPFVFTSTTSVMIDQALHEERGDMTVWLDESYGPLAPRNIYGVSKLCAENLCRQHHQTRGLNAIVLRTARFFPHGEARRSGLSGANRTVNELLNRRASVDDMARAHITALDRAGEVGFGLYIVSAPTRLSRSDLVALKRDAGFVIRRHYPEAAHFYGKLRWEMPRTLGRVYDGSRITRDLGFAYETDFLKALRAEAFGQPSPLVRAGPRILTAPSLAS